MDLDLLLIVVPVVVLAVIVTFGLVRTRRQGGDPDAPTPAIDSSNDVAVLDEPQVLEAPDDTTVTEAPAAPAEAPAVEEITLAERFKRRLVKTRNVLGASVADLFGRGITDEAWEGLEEALIAADIGVAATMELVEAMRTRVREEGITSGEGALELLKQQLRAILGDPDRTLHRANGDNPTTWLVTGVNGTGKTTTIGKLSAREQRDGRTVVLGAADTFRAAAAEQLGLWADRTGARLVRKDEGADPASVAFDAWNAAKATDADVCIIDTAGRLHNKRELMDELGKVKRVVEKQAGAFDEVLLVLDGTTGQNGIAQAKAFTEAVAVTGLVLTKLDGSSKGGVVVAVQQELGLPVKLVGLGEDVDDLADFDPDLFVEGLFADL